MPRKRVMVVGAAGQLGEAIVAEFGRDHDVVPLTRAALDITVTADVRRVVGAERPAVVVNCAAYNDVDGAEDDAVRALEVNAFAVRALARAAADAGARLVHYGTDFVFDGEADRPYEESDEPNPRSSYAASKLLGDWFAADAGRYYVLRVESLFGRAPIEGRRGGSSVDRIVDAIRNDREARVFVDRVVSPSYVIDVAKATRTLIERGAPDGLYHCVNSGHTTWHDLAVEIGRVLGREPRLVPVRVAEVQLGAQRPRYCALSNAKLAAAGASMPTWQDAIARYVAHRIDS